MTTNYKPVKKLGDLDLNSELKTFDSAARSKRAEAISIADYRSERGEVVAALVAAAATEANDEVSLGYAERMKSCADRQNFYYGEDFLDSSTGELFEGFGNLFGCGLKLCQSCMARAAARNRRIARQAVQATKLLRREHFCHETGKWIIDEEKLRFVTLTMPKIDASLIITFAILRRAFDLFRKLKFTKDHFGGFIKSGEFTVREDRTYHAHIHLLAISFFVPEALIKMHWTNCVEKAFSEAGIEFLAKQANVNLQLVYSKAKPKDKGKIISYEDAITETCKYMTKTESWEKIPSDQLLEITRIKRWDRMFEVTGRFRQTLKLLNAEKEQASSDVGKDATSTDGLARELSYFNTDGITDGETSDGFGCSEETAAKPHEILKKPKRESWRDIIEREGLEKYLEIFYRQVDYAQKIRKLRLILKFPLANFSYLDGRPWDLAEIEQFAQQLAARGVEVLPA
jgi:hypothetical protein